MPFLVYSVHYAMYPMIEIKSVVNRVVCPFSNFVEEVVALDEAIILDERD